MVGQELFENLLGLRAVAFAKNCPIKAPLLLPDRALKFIGHTATVSLLEAYTHFQRFGKWIRCCQPIFPLYPACTRASVFLTNFRRTGPTQRERYSVGKHAESRPRARRPINALWSAITRRNRRLHSTIFSFYPRKIMWNIELRGFKVLNRAIDFCTQSGAR